MSHPDMSKVRNNDEPSTSIVAAAFTPGMEVAALTLADHLMKDHGYQEADIMPLRDNPDAASWLQLNNLHSAARQVGGRGHIATPGALG